jgi:CTP synthase
MEIGIQPQVLICRAEQPLSKEIKRKIALFTNVDMDAVLESPDLSTIYEVPLSLKRQKADDVVLDLLGLKDMPQPDLTEWTDMVRRVQHPASGEARIAVVGKYTELVDSYKSVQEALIHGGIANDAKVSIDWLLSEAFDSGEGVDRLADYDGILIPGGFGARGVEGMLHAIRWAREGQVPFFGICLGLQCAVIEFARNVCGLPEANSTEFDPDTPDPVIALLDSQLQVTDKGGTMRLGAYACMLREGTRARDIYGRAEISERHRHRWEVNNAYREPLSLHGMTISGTSPDGGLVEMIEISDHPWFVAGQFHPELKSRPTRPHPLFASFIEAASRSTERSRAASIEHAAGV